VILLHACGFENTGLQNILWVAISSDYVRFLHLNFWIPSKYVDVVVANRNFCVLVYLMTTVPEYIPNTEEYILRKCNILTMIFWVSDTR